HGGARLAAAAGGTAGLPRGVGDVRGGGIGRRPGRRTPAPMNLLVVSNRLPVTIGRDDAGEIRIEAGRGGLLTALLPVLRDRGGRWIGWTGVTREEVPDGARLLRRAARSFGYGLTPIELSAEERDLYYHGFSNEVLWPLFHDMLSLCRFE